VLPHKPKSRPRGDRSAAIASRAGSDLRNRWGRWRINKMSLCRVRTGRA
jgi:hypothetical protein